MAVERIPGDTSIRTIKPGDPRRRLSDGNGLYLLLFVKGGAHGWRLDYTHSGRRKTLSLGTYPDTLLSEARRKASEARRSVAAGIDPSDLRKAARQAIASRRDAAKRVAAGLPAVDSFEAVAREWYEIKRDQWAPGYGSKIIRRFEVDIFPYLGSAPVGSITPPILLRVVRQIEARGVLETAHRALENCSQVMRYAVSTGRAESNPARDLKGALKTPFTKHFPAIIEPKRLGELLRAIDGYAGTPIVRAALALAPMLLLRPGELRHASWQEIDLDAATWTIPSSRMKRTVREKRDGDPHLVPLPRQAVELLDELRPLTGQFGTGYVFRGERHHDRPMSENTVNAALRAMGFSADEVTGHGFRATARTMLQERLSVDPNVVEAQLAHEVRDALGRAYNRTQFLEQRRVMMRTWADYLDDLRANRPIATGGPSSIGDPRQ